MVGWDLDACGREPKLTHDKLFSWTLLDCHYPFPITTFRIFLNFYSPSPPNKTYGVHLRVQPLVPQSLAHGSSSPSSMQCHKYTSNWVLFLVLLDLKLRYLPYFFSFSNLYYFIEEQILYVQLVRFKVGIFI